MAILAFGCAVSTALAAFLVVTVTKRLCLESEAALERVHLHVKMHMQSHPHANNDSSIFDDSGETTDYSSSPSAIAANAAARVPEYVG